MAKPAKSYVHGTSPTPLIGETIGANLERACARWPDNEALVVRHQGLRWTYERLNREAGTLAAGLLALGLEPGERVGIWSPNNAESFPTITQKPIVAAMLPAAARRL